MSSRSTAGPPLPQNSGRSDSNPEFAILGAGAIGSIIGAHLARAGHSVLMLARGRRADIIRSKGLSIRGLAEFSAPVGVITEPSLLRTAKVLIVAMKTPGTAEALAALSHVQVDASFSIQNGTLKDELLTETFGPQRVLGSLADTSGELLPDGTVIFTRNVNILLGELSGAAGERAVAIAATLDAAGVRAAAVPDIRNLEWSKFAAWTGLLVLSVITRTVTWRYLSDPAAARVLVGMTREMGKLARALGVELTDQAVLPAATLTRGTEEDAVAAVLDVGRRFAAHAPEHRMSSLQDLEAGRPLEIHETLGYAVKKAQALGIAVPLLAAFYEMVSALDTINTQRDGESAPPRS